LVMFSISITISPTGRIVSEFVMLNERFAKPAE
jgi:hypothetical protein